jgi:hypothetical protein
VIGAWSCPGPSGKTEEYALSFDQGRLNHARPCSMKPTACGGCWQTPCAAGRGRIAFSPGISGAMKSSSGIYRAEPASAGGGARCSTLPVTSPQAMCQVRGAVMPQTLPGIVYEPAKGRQSCATVRARIDCCARSRTTRTPRRVEQGRTTGWTCRLPLLARR